MLAGRQPDPGGDLAAILEVVAVADALAQAGDFLRQDDAEFGYQAAQSAIGCGALFNKALAGAVQAQDDLLMFFLDGAQSAYAPG